MPVHSPGDQRWRHTGHNSAGDRVYSRVLGDAGRDYTEMTKVELQALAESRGLAKSGTKDEIIERLNEDG